MCLAAVGAVGAEVEQLERLVVGVGLGKLEGNHRQNDQNEKIAVSVYLDETWIDVRVVDPLGAESDAAGKG